MKSALMLVLVAVVAGCRVDDLGTEPDAGTVLVDIREAAFSPETVHVAVGGRVRWTNRGAEVHAISGASFSSQNLFPTWWFEARFDAAGAFDYFCALHEEKEGTVIVE